MADADIAPIAAIPAGQFYLACAGCQNRRAGWHRKINTPMHGIIAFNRVFAHTIAGRDTGAIYRGAHQCTYRGIACFIIPAYLSIKMFMTEEMQTLTGNAHAGILQVAG